VSNAKPPFHSIGNEIFDSFGHHVLSIGFAPNNDKVGWARKVCRLLCMEHALTGRRINIQGIEGMRNEERNGT
jgi:hypothetical protein